MFALSRRNGTSCTPANCGPNCGPSLAVVPAFNTTFGSMLNEFFNDPFFTDTRPSVSPAAMLPVDVSETDTHFTIRAQVPGYTRDQLSIELHDGVLAITAGTNEEVVESTDEKSQQAERWHRREIRTGMVTRRFKLPTPVVEDRIEADLKDGVLTLRLPKTPEATPRKIKIG